MGRVGIEPLTTNEVWQRLPVALSCIAFLALERFKDSQPTAGLLFVAVVALSCPEKLASIANTVAIERDWVRFNLDLA